MHERWKGDRVGEEEASELIRLALPFPEGTSHGKERANAFNLDPATGLKSCTDLKFGQMRPCFQNELL